MAPTLTKCGRCQEESGLGGHTIRTCLNSMNFRCWQDIWGKMSKDSQSCIADTLGKKLELNWVKSSKQKQLCRDEDKLRETITLGVSKLCAIRNLELFLACKSRKTFVCCLLKCITCEGHWSTFTVWEVHGGGEVRAQRSGRPNCVSQNASPATCSPTSPVDEADSQSHLVNMSEPEVRRRGWQWRGQEHSPGWHN